MRFLVDENLAPILADLLRAAGHNASHVREIELQSATAQVVMDRAEVEQRVVVSADTEFGTLPARNGQSRLTSIQRRPKPDRLETLSLEEMARAEGWHKGPGQYGRPQQQLVRPTGQSEGMVLAQLGYVVRWLGVRYKPGISPP